MTKTSRAQQDYLYRLGYDGDTSELSSAQAGKIINELRPKTEKTKKNDEKYAERKAFLRQQYIDDANMKKHIGAPVPVPELKFYVGMEYSDAPMEYVQAATPTDRLRVTEDITKATLFNRDLANAVQWGMREKYDCVRIVSRCGKIIN